VFSCAVLVRMRLQTGPGHAALGPGPCPRARATLQTDARRQARCSINAGSPAPMLVVSGIWLECSDEYSTSTVMSVWASVAFRNLGGLFFFSVDAPTSCP
jgi:hypothetical protein